MNIKNINELGSSEHLAILKLNTASVINQYKTSVN